MKASVLITVYNCWPIALKAIESHLKYGGDFIDRIVVIDDCSKDDIPEALPEKVFVIRNQENLGYVKSINIGFSHINSEIVLLFDADAIPLKEYGNELKFFFIQNPLVGAIGFRTVDRNGDNTGISEPVPNYWSLLLGQKLYSYYEKCCLGGDSIIVFSCAMAVRRRIVQEIEGFDESFDFLDADADFSIRIGKEGWDLKIVESLLALHEGGGSPQSTSKRVLRHYVNRHKLLIKHGGWKFQRLYKCIILLRLKFELVLMKSLKTFIFKDPIVLNDKIKGRKDIIAYVSSVF